MTRTIGMMAALALLTACGDGEAGAGGVTAEESRQLNEAAEMLDAAPETVIAADETGLANAEASAETGDVLIADTNSANAQ